MPGKPQKRESQFPPHFRAFPWTPGHTCPLLPQLAEWTYPILANENILNILLGFPE